MSRSRKPRLHQAETVTLDSLTPHPRNYRGHPDDQLAHIEQSLREHGQYRNIVVARDGTILAGHGVAEAARRVGLAEVSVIRLPVGRDDPRALRLLAGDNETGRLAAVDDEALAGILRDIYERDVEGLLGTGWDEDDLARLLGPSDRSTLGSLAERFGLPPMSVLDARSGAWQQRKREWKSTGLDDAAGRGGGLVYRSGAPDPVSIRMQEIAGGTSLFDPVLAEILIRWFTAPGMAILDPMSGGATRGIVAATLGRHYTGIDIRPEQIDANRATAARLIPTDALCPEWITGDAQDIIDLAGAEMYDMILTCPPYGDLEVYSDDPRDLSQMDPSDFRNALVHILADAATLLRDDRFAVIVVGEYRTTQGGLAGLTSLVVESCTRAGLAYYNEAILVTPIGTSQLGAGRPFQTSRKLRRTHQTVLVFVKGDPRAATDACGAVDMTGVAEPSSDSSPIVQPA